MERQSVSSACTRYSMRRREGGCSGSNCKRRDQSSGARQRVLLATRNPLLTPPSRSLNPPLISLGTSRPSFGGVSAESCPCFQWRFGHVHQSARIHAQEAALHGWPAIQWRDEIGRAHV